MDMKSSTDKDSTDVAKSKTMLVRAIWRQRWIWLLLAIAAGAGVYAYVAPRKAPQGEAQQTSSQGGQGGKRGAGGMRMPVVTAAARSGDINVYLNGLGSVTPLNSVTVRTRVDGQLMKVLFREGQIVKRGEL